MTSTEQPKASQAKKAKRSQGNAPAFNLSSELNRISGVDLTRIDGVNVIVAQTVISEVGLDMSRWKTEAHFAFHRHGRPVRTLCLDRQGD